MTPDQVKYIVLHCSDSPNSLDDTRLDDAATIHAWHKLNDWAGIGSHYVISEKGDLQNGRPEYWAGAHVRGHNHESIGVCLIGYGDFNPQQWVALKRIVCDLRLKFPGAQVVGHRDLDSKKECPGFNVALWLQGGMRALSY